MVIVRLQLALFLVFVSAGIARTQDITPAPPKCLSSWKDATTEKDLCIRKNTFNHDLCSSIEYFATKRQVPPDFFARLIWRESRFRPGAVSPKGAEGIAQFMPGTARLRGLADSFDILSALDASATYIHDLHERFGGLGQAAAAYNAGEAGFRRFANGASLPFETRAYVIAITGHSIEEWASKPPEKAAAPLDPEKTFISACVALAESRRLSPGHFMEDGPWAPWGVQLAAHINPNVARSLFARAVARLPAPLNEELPVIVHQTRGNFGHRGRYAARIGRQTRSTANEVCAVVKASGGACSVWRN